MVPLIARPRLITALAEGGPVVAVDAPAGFGKTTLLDEAAGSASKLVRVPVALTEGLPALLSEAVAWGLRRTFAGAAVAAVRALPGRTGWSEPQTALGEVMERLGVSQLTLAFDEVERVGAGPLLGLIAGLMVAPPVGLRVVVAGRGLGTLGLLPYAQTTITASELAFTAEEARVVGGSGGADRALGGWPALVAARAESLDVAALLDETLGALSGPTRFVAYLAGVVGPATVATLGAVAQGEVPGTPSEQQRLLRLSGEAFERAILELEAHGLMEICGEEAVTRAGVAGLAAQVFRERHEAGWREAERRAGEAEWHEAGGEVSAALVDRFAAAGSGARVLELLRLRGAELELELAERGDDARLVRWCEAVGGEGPAWLETLRALGLARTGAWDEAARVLGALEWARGERARGRQEGGGTEWAWDARRAEAHALVGAGRGDWAAARSWLTRARDRVEEALRGEEARGQEVVLGGLQARLRALGAWWSAAQGDWEVARAALHAAWQEARRGERWAAARALQAGHLAGALAAGDRESIREVIRCGEASLASVAGVIEGLLESGDVAAARVALSGEHSELGSLLAARLGDRGQGSGLAEVRGAVVGGSTVRSELVVRSGGGGAWGEGYLGAVVLELGGRLEAAREGYRRVGARWDEARLGMVLGVAALDNDDKGPGATPAAAMLAQALTAAATGGWALPWALAGEAGRVVAALVAGERAAAGETSVRAILSAELARRGVTAAGDRARGAATRGARLARREVPFVVWGRDGNESSLSLLNYRELLNNVPRNQFIVCVPDQTVLSFGAVVDLGQKRVLLPLLLALLRTPEVGQSMAQLARTVWHEEVFTATVQTKVKVGMSRLRALLGREVAVIETVRVVEEGEAVAGYQIAQDLVFSVVEATQTEVGAR